MSIQRRANTRARVRAGLRRSGQHKARLFLLDSRRCAESAFSFSRNESRDTLVNAVHDGSFRAKRLR